MVVNLIKKDRIFSLTLPSKVSGRYWLYDYDESNNTRNLSSVEAENGKWIIKSNKDISLYDSSLQKVDSCQLDLQSFLLLKVKQSGENVRLFIEDTDESRQTLKKIIAIKPGTLTIGRSPDNNISYDNKFVGGIHARLSFDGERWSITDENSKNGTFVNGKRVTNTLLRCSDYIYIMGLKIIVGNKFIAINNPDGLVKLKSTMINDYKPQKANVDFFKTDILEKENFSRSPRFQREVERSEITLDSPPQLEKNNEVPLALMLGPSLTMGITSLSTGVFALLNANGNLMQSLPTLIMSISMLLGTVLWPVLTKKYETRINVKNEQKRQEKYLEYLSEIGNKIKQIAVEQSDILNANLVPQEECVERIVRKKRNLWERVIGQKDFLCLRLGTGTIPLNLDIKYQKKKFSMDDDSLQNAMISLAEQPKLLKNVPVSLSLIDSVAVGLYGNKMSTEGLLKSLVLQMVSLQSYDELKLILLVDEKDIESWSFTKCIPHFWNEEKSFRFFASNNEEVKALSLYLEDNVLIRPDEQYKSYSENVPYYVVIGASSELVKKCEALNKLLEYKNNIGFSVIFTGHSFSDFPKETKTVVYVDANNSKLFDKNDTSGAQLKFDAELVNSAVLKNISFNLANIELETLKKEFLLPQTITFLEMFNVGKVEHLNSLLRWKENNPTTSLQTPVGIAKDGDLFTLDLHEKYQGPHGLVAGMTGSGKSEFIITYILSLAVNYHPDEVAFILIDYKGGGLADAFKDEERRIKLPHLAGTITNLDGASIKRSLISIQSELRRRQEIFSKAKKLSNDGTMDIYAYQQLYRNKVVEEPLPHLFIISDEFAELKKQQPDFMDELISAARIGRSLGIHLILATQKPSGVVDDQIWSNSRFRVCLKVQEKSDSQDMIKCSDAAELIQTGRFYLQVGFNEFFAQGQSAWCGADYIPTDFVEKTVDSSIQVIDNLGRVTMSVSPEKNTQKKLAQGKQVVAIVKYLSELADNEGVGAKPLWLEPLPSKIHIDEIEKKYGNSSVNTYLEPLIGEYDDPFNQKQNALTIPLSKDGNCIVYGAAGMGKTTLLTTMCYSLIKHHTADEVNIYIMDFGSETLKMFEKSPQVGGVVTAIENEKVINLLKMLREEIESRKAMFSEYGGDYSSYIENKSEHIMPNIVVIVNDFSGFSEQYEDLLDEFVYLSRDGVKYGIYFVISASNLNAVRYRIQQNFKTLMTLRLNDTTDYPIIVGRNEGLIPSNYKGRGLINIGNVFEFQTAYCTDAKDVGDFVKKMTEFLADKSKSKAKPIPALPGVVNSNFVYEYFDGFETIPVGVSKHNLNVVTYDLSQKVMLPVISQELYSTKYFVEEFVNVVSTKIKTIVLTYEPLSEGFGDVYTSDFESQVVQLFEEMVLRNNTYVDSGRVVQSLEKFDERFYIIVGLSNILESLSNDGKEKLSLAIENAATIYKIRFVIVDTSDRISTLSSQPWYKRYLSGSDGLWIGDGFADQYIFKISRMTTELYDEIGFEYGYLVRKNRPTLIKTLSSNEEVV